MIDPNWTLEDVDPVTWRNIGHLFVPAQYIAAAQPDEHGLFVLHDAGKRPKIVDTTRGVREDLGIEDVEDARALAAELYARGEWQRVHVIDKRHLACVAAEAQATPRRDLSIDAYYQLVYQLVWNGSDGYVAVPPHAGSWHGFTYAALREFVARAASPSTMCLCVPEHIHLVLTLENGRIHRVTTFEGLLQLPRPRVNAEFFDTLWAELAQPYAVLLCTRPVFDEWLYSVEKGRVLEAARACGEAFWRVR
jgi:hypothetical protein